MNMEITVPKYGDNNTKIKSNADYCTCAAKLTNFHPQKNCKKTNCCISNLPKIVKDSNTLAAYRSHFIKTTLHTKKHFQRLIDQ